MASLTRERVEIARGELDYDPERRLYQLGDGTDDGAVSTKLRRQRIDAAPGNTTSIPDTRNP